MAHTSRRQVSLRAASAQMATSVRTVASERAAPRSVIAMATRLTLWVSFARMATTEMRVSPDTPPSTTASPASRASSAQLARSSETAPPASFASNKPTLTLLTPLRYQTRPTRALLASIVAKAQSNRQGVRQQRSRLRRLPNRCQNVPSVRWVGTVPLMRLSLRFVQKEHIVDSKSTSRITVQLARSSLMRRWVT